MNILIIEDDLFLAEQIQKTFLSFWFANRVKLLHSYQDFLYLQEKISGFDILLIDIDLGDSSNTGLSILRYVRALSSSIPVIIMSSYDGYEFLEEAFQFWAHDYIIKPFRSRELQIRIQRWFRNYVFFEYYAIDKEILYHDLCYNVSSYQFFYKNEEIFLSKSSKYLFSLFVIHKEKILSHSFLAEKIWWNDQNIEKNIRMKVMRLKQQLWNIPLSSWIINIPWEGYIFASQDA